MNSRLAELAKAYQANKSAGVANELDIENPVKREALADKYLLIGLGLAGILEWTGVLEADVDKPAPLTEEKIDELFSNFWAVAENFRHQYCGLQEILDAEKNASSPEPSGTSEMGGATVPDAEKADFSAPLQNANTQKLP